jgi:hypothetical protein
MRMRKEEGNDATQHVVAAMINSENKSNNPLDRVSSFNFPNDFLFRAIIPVASGRAQRARK